MQKVGVQPAKSRRAFNLDKNSSVNNSNAWTAKWSYLQCERGIIDKQLFELMY